MEPTEALKNIIAQRGIDVLQQPDVVAALLNDYCPQSKPEIYLLASSLKEGVPQRLLSAPTAGQRKAAIGQTREYMETNLAMQPEKALWTVNAWLQALSLEQEEPSRKTDETEYDQTAKPEPMPTPQPVPVRRIDRAEQTQTFLAQRLRGVKDPPSLVNFDFFQKIESELMERGVAKRDATLMIHRHFKKKRQAAENTRRTVARFGWFLATVVCFMLFLFIFGNPVTLAMHTPAFASEAFRRASANNYRGVLDLAGGALAAIILVSVGITSLKKW